MDKIEYLIKQSLMEDIPIPPQYDTMIYNTLKDINKHKDTLKDKIFKIIVSILTAILGMTGICFAVSEVYNYILEIQQGKTLSSGLGDTEDGTKESLLNSDMEWDRENAFYYKIIENIDDYTKYKNKVDELPSMKNEDFESNFLLIITSIFPRKPDEKNLQIVDITSNEETTFIKLNQEGNINDDEFNNIIYAIIPKDQLRENIKIEIEHFNIYLPEFGNINNLPTDYSVDDAIKDGCFVLEKSVLKSDNVDALDKLMNASTENKESSIRIYDKVMDNEILITDIIYKDGLYYMNTCNISNSEREIQYNSFETISKGELQENESKMIIYSGMTKLYKSEFSQGIPIVLFTEE